MQAALQLSSAIPGPPVWDLLGLQGGEGRVCISRGDTSKNSSWALAGRGTTDRPCTS